MSKDQGRGRYAKYRLWQTTAVEHYIRSSNHRSCDICPVDSDTIQGGHIIFNDASATPSLVCPECFQFCKSLFKTTTAAVISKGNWERWITTLSDTEKYLVALCMESFIAVSEARVSGMTNDMNTVQRRVYSIISAGFTNYPRFKVAGVALYMMNGQCFMGIGIPRTAGTMIEYAPMPTTVCLSGNHILLHSQSVSNIQKCCSYCHKKSVDLKICSGCNWLRYCSVSCQKDDWASHKKSCTDVKVYLDKYGHKLA